MNKEEHIADRSVLFSVFKLLSYKKIRKAGFFCAETALRNFFGLQYRQLLSPRKLPVYAVDHPLDAKVPFKPEKVTIYLNFVYFWIRAAAFLMERFGEAAEEEVADFVKAMGRLYNFASEVYQQGFSTTKRPRYFKNIRFIIIHIFDPHLMCIPSLHVMVVCKAYTSFRAIAERLGAREELEPYIDELRTGALAITESILYVKQHSVNCIPAAFYALTVFDPVLFSPEEMEDLIKDMFTDTKVDMEEARDEVKTYIQSLYYQFMKQQSETKDWTYPLVSFLETRPVTVPVSKKLAQKLI